jgi:DAK2 domain fusion protein YloV
METLTVNKKISRVTCSGRELREMFCTATRHLERNAAEINALNVFPVPDGDTGTNMLLTMRSTMAEAARPPDTNASDIADAMARGALMGARGNSGVILSQIMKGFASGLQGRESFGPAELAAALEQASNAAYAGLSKPREGTMLTVIKEVAAAAQSCACQNDSDLLDLMEKVVDEAKKSVDRTPELLDVLKQAGVVDAGGQGVYVILKGILDYLRGEDPQDAPAETEVTVIKKDSFAFKQPAFVAAKSVSRKEKAYGYCTELIVRGEDLDQAQVRRWIESQGESALVVGDGRTVKVHVHTLHPGTVVEFAISLGSVHDLKIENMDDQNEEFLQQRRAAAPAPEIAVVAVVAGTGLEDVFCSLGTTTIVSGGQTMNPSCADILEAIDAVASDRVIILPNNKNIIPTAKQAAGVTRKNVKVVPTRSVPQGLSALVGFNPRSDLDANVKEMVRAQDRVRSVEITIAVRDARMGDLQIKKGEYIGLVDGNIRVAGRDLHETVFRALEAAGLDNAEILTLFYGDTIGGDQAADLAAKLRERCPGPEVEVIQGGQPHYAYIISVE